MNKISFEEWKKGIANFLDFPDVESEIESEIKDNTREILLTKAHNGSRPAIDVLTNYLEGDTEDKKLKIIVGLAGSSVEKLKRVFKAKFPEIPWGRWAKEDLARRWVASFLINPYEETKIFIPKFIRGSFSLPDDWINRLKSEESMSAVVRHSMGSKYSVRMGFELENQIKERVKKAGLECTKGSVLAVDNKEVDVAVPNLSHPHTLIMSSYSLTTASSQTTRANEQAAMYRSVQTYNGSRSMRGKRKCLFINVVDGGGWIARKKDLEHLWDNCDYCFTFSSLDKLEELLR